MKEKLFSKKKLTGFSPELHWDMMLLLIVIVLVGISVYFSYLYITLSHRIDENTSSLNNDSSKVAEEQSIQKIINMEAVIVSYREKEKTYGAVIDALAKKVPVVEAKISTSTATTSPVATSSVR